MEIRRNRIGFGIGRPAVAGSVTKEAQGTQRGFLIVLRNTRYTKVNLGFGERFEEQVRIRL